MKLAIALFLALSASAASAQSPCSPDGTCTVALTAPSFASTIARDGVAFQSRSGARLQLNDPLDGEHVWLWADNDENMVRVTGSNGSAALRVDGILGVTGGTTIGPSQLYVGDGDGSDGVLWVDQDGTRIGGAWATPIAASYRATFTADVGAVAAGTCTDIAVVVTGAAVGADAVCAPPPTLPAGLSATCFVSAPDTAQFRLCNVTSGDIYPQSLTYGVRVLNP